MNKSEKVFDLAKRLVSLQQELNECDVDTDPLVKLIEDVSKKAVSYAKKEIRGFGEGSFLKSDTFELNEEDKLRWQKLAGILEQKEAKRRAEEKATEAEARAKEIRTKFFLDINRFPEDTVVKVVEEFKSKLQEQSNKELDGLIEEARERDKFMTEMKAQMSPAWEENKDK